MWAEFTVALTEINDDGDEVPAGIKSLGMIDTTTVTRFYASLDVKNNPCVILKFFDGETLLVYESYKEVKQKLKPIITLTE